MFSFEGRIGRGEWWGLSILLIVVTSVAAVVSFFIFPPLIVLVGLASVIASWAIDTRRCHDLGWSGWVNLIRFIPGVGSLILFVIFGFFPGNRDRNQYDPPLPYNPTPAHLGYLVSSDSAVHPSLRSANDRAWQSNARKY